MPQTGRNHSVDGRAATLSMVTIDCSDPARMAGFGANALGWTKAFSDGDYGTVEGEGVRLGFGRSEGFEPSPLRDHDAANRFHLDLKADGLDGATERLC